LLFSLASAGFWVRSYFVQEVVSHYSAWAGQAMYSVDGKLKFMKVTPDFAFSDDWLGVHYHTIESGPQGAAQLIDFRFVSFDFIGIEVATGKWGALRDCSLVLPWWLIALVLAVLPSAWIWASFGSPRRKYRIAHNLCLRCGYDLRASVDRCPECGEPIRSIKAETSPFAYSRRAGR